MSGALNSVFGGGNILGAGLNVCGMLFPPLGVATSLANLLTQTAGQAVCQAADELTQVANMPKFIAKEVGQIVQKMLGDLLKQSEPECDHHVQDRCGGQFRDIGNDMVRDMVNNAIEHMRCGDKKKGCGSWYEALANALGEALDKQAAKIEKLSGEITNENAKDKPSTMTELQAASQKMSFMMSTTDNILKTLGEALKEGVRKG